MKECSRCGEEKDLSLFQKRKASVDGYTASCKSCLSIYDKLRANNPDRVKARKDYAKTADGIAARDRGRKKWAKNNKGKIYEITKRYRENNKNKYIAHGKVAYEIKVGNLSPLPCEVCFNTHDLHAHHDDYSKPLNIRWLCCQCHADWHKENGEGKNG